VGKKVDAVFDGKLRLLGVELPERADAGSRVKATLLWRVESEVSGHVRVFVHASPASSDRIELKQKHKVARNAVPTSEWRTGDVIVDAFDIKIPKGVQGTMVFYAGVYTADGGTRDRWAVSPSSAGDEESRVELGHVLVGAAKPKKPKEPKEPGDASGAPPSADVPQRKGAIKIDGVADEPDWKTAAAFAFHPHDGKATITRKTSARMLWDAEALYLSFDVEDPDPFTVYTKRDDPIYDSEATEIFIDADGDKDVYVELQSAADDLHFDAAFAGGARKNMDKAWNSPFETKTKKTDKGYTSEWRIPVASLKDIPAGEPKAGATWKVNLFRLERVRALAEAGANAKDAKDAKVTKNEASAWSPPLSGDFHTLDRFGTITFRE
jgi:hypothetical protein